MPVDTAYVTSAAARAAWNAWTDALAARCEHELACRDAGGGCDTKGTYCLIGFDLHEAEQAAHDAYRETTDAAEVQAA